MRTTSPLKHANGYPAWDFSAIIIVMPGQIFQKKDTSVRTILTHKLRDGLTQSLNEFKGRICGVVMDMDLLQISNHPALESAFHALMTRTERHAIVCADRIDERDRTSSALTIAQSLIGKSELRPGYDTICLTGSGWDGTDRPVDLLAYAFRGLGFQTILDPNVRLPGAQPRPHAQS